MYKVFMCCRAYGKSLVALREKEPESMSFVLFFFGEFIAG